MDALGFDRHGVDLTHVRPGVRDGHVPDVQVPVPHKGPLHADAHVIDDSSVLYADRRLSWTDPHHLQNTNHQLV